MEDMLGDALDMAVLAESDVNVSALDTHEHAVQHDDGGDDGDLDDTTDHKDDATRDCSAGCTVTIRKLSQLDKKVTTNSSDVLDIKNMIIDLAHNVGKLSSTVEMLTTENVHLRDKVHQLSQQQDTLIATMSTYS